MRTIRPSIELIIPNPVLESQKTEQTAQAERKLKGVSEGKFYMKVEISKKIPESPKPAVKRPMSAGANRVNLTINTGLFLASRSRKMRSDSLRSKSFLGKEPIKPSCNVTKKAREFRRKYPVNWKPLTVSTVRAKLRDFMVRGYSPVKQEKNPNNSFLQMSSIGTTI